MEGAKSHLNAKPCTWNGCSPNFQINLQHPYANIHQFTEKIKENKIKLMVVPKSLE